MFLCLFIPEYILSAVSAPCYQPVLLVKFTCCFSESCCFHKLSQSPIDVPCRILPVFLLLNLGRRHRMGQTYVGFLWALLRPACPRTHVHVHFGLLAIVPNNPDSLGSLATSFQGPCELTMPRFLFPFPGSKERMSFESRVSMASLSLFSFPSQE